MLCYVSLTGNIIVKEKISVSHSDEVGETTREKEIRGNGQI